MRYTMTETGVSEMLHPPIKDTVIKVNSYTHDEAGISTERADLAAMMTEKRQKKGAALAEEVAHLNAVEIGGIAGSDHALLCWGSTLGVCREVALKTGLRLVQPIVLSPLPVDAVKNALQGANRVIAVEENFNGQLAMLLAGHGIRVDEQIHRYDGRPFSLEELEARVREVLA